MNLATIVTAWIIVLGACLLVSHEGVLDQPWAHQVLAAAARASR